MKEYEVESIARYEAEQVAGPLKGRIEQTEERIAEIDEELYQLQDIKSKVAKRLEEASHELQFCEDAADVASILVDLFNEIAEMLKEWG